MKKQFDGKVVAISGGLGDIALATALLFGQQGATVVLSDLAPAEDAVEKLAVLQENGIRYTYASVDVASHDHVTQWLDQSIETFGHVDMGVVNAATVTIKKIAEIKPDEWASEIAINLNGAFFMAQKIVLHQVEKQIKGNIVFLGSWAAHAVHAHIPAYSVSKAGIRMLCQSLALEFASHGIKVNEIAPGYVNAGLSKAVWDANPDAALQAKHKVPLQELIEASEVANNILWLCQEENRHITGSCLLMDGGLSLLRP